MGFFKMLDDFEADAIEGEPRKKKKKGGKEKKVGYKLDFEKGKKPIKAFGGSKLSKGLL